VNSGAEVVAFDKSERMVAHARQLTQGAARIEVADLTNSLALSGLADRSIDLAVASLVLHYLPDWSGLLGEVFRSLRPGGALVMSVHHPITGWLLSDRADYHRTELVTEMWDVDGVKTAARMWRRPVAAVFTPLLDEGFVIDAVHEPSPELDEDAVPNERTREALNTSPVFLYVRAQRPVIASHR
jgi:SAM-dependent methyltransferase